MPRSGATGLGLSPVAFVLEPRQYGLGTNYYTDRDIAAGERRRYYSVAATFGVGGGTEVGLFQSRWALIGRESWQASGVTVKQRLAKNLAAGFAFFQGQVDGSQLFLAARFPLTSPESKKPLEAHFGVLHVNWRIRIARNEELLPYAGLAWTVKDRWQLTAEMRDRQDFARKPAWLLAAHFKLNRSWQLSVGAVQSGFSDNSRPFVALSFGAGIFAPR